MGRLFGTLAASMKLHCNVNDIKRLMENGGITYGAFQHSDNPEVSDAHRGRAGRGSN